jgi:hypothetical protein
MPYELPPSHGWPCSVENNLFSKQTETHIKNLSFMIHAGLGDGNASRGQLLSHFMG